MTLNISYLSLARDQKFVRLVFDSKIIVIFVPDTDSLPQLTSLQFKKEVIFVPDKDPLGVGGELVVAAVGADGYHGVVLAEGTDAARPTRHLTKTIGQSLNHKYHPSINLPIILPK